jgi:DNA-directed RNA polymerase subunit M/transcription elongation factor TFIIS
MIEFPKCPKCNANMVPISGTDTGRNRGYDFTVVLPFEKWVCSKCGYEVK